MRTLDSSIVRSSGRENRRAQLRRIAWSPGPSRYRKKGLRGVESAPALRGFVPWLRPEFVTVAPTPVCVDPKVSVLAPRSGSNSEGPKPGLPHWAFPGQSCNRR